jgi:chromosome partitioning protein
LSPAPLKHRATVADPLEGRAVIVRSIAWISEKGGTAKTTCAINVGAALAKRGKRVLLVDCDPQASATLVLTEGRQAEPPTLADVLLGRADPLDALRPTRWPELTLLPAVAALADVALVVANEVGRECRLRAALAEISGYDVAILDTNPARSMLSVNALVAAQELLIPVDPGLFALAGLGSLLEAAEQARRYLGAASRVAGIVLTRTRRDNVSRDVERELRERFGPLVLKTTIPQAVAIEEAHGRFTSVLDYAPGSPGAKAYAALAAEILEHGERSQARAGTVARDVA